MTDRLLIPADANRVIIEECDPRTLDRAEDRVIRRLGPLTRTTTPEQWDAYWQAVADEIVGAK